MDGMTNPRHDPNLYILDINVTLGHVNPLMSTIDRSSLNRLLAVALLLSGRSSSTTPTGSGSGVTKG